MDCNAARNLLHGYVDGELDLVNSLQMEEHLRTCPDCAHAYEQLQSLRSALKDPALCYQAPARLSRRLEAAIRKADREAAPRWRAWSWTGMAAAACMILLALYFWRILPASFQENRLSQEVLADHVRSLMVNHLADVPSTDQHTVKPWFNGKLPYSPPVTDLAQQGFPLVGGRLDYLNNRPVAALVYGRGKHYINVFVWPTPPGANTEASPQLEEMQGYHLIHWQHAGMTYWAVSDVSDASLQTFVQLLRR